MRTSRAWISAALTASRTASALTRWAPRCASEAARIACSSSHESIMMGAGMARGAGAGGMGGTTGTAGVGGVGGGGGTWATTVMGSSTTIATTNVNTRFITLPHS
jgi:hypothetical protein